MNCPYNAVCVGACPCGCPIFQQRNDRFKYILNAMFQIENGITQNLLLRFSVIHNELRTTLIFIISYEDIRFHPIGDFAPQNPPLTPPLIKGGEQDKYSLFFGLKAPSLFKEVFWLGVVETRGAYLELTLNLGFNN